MPFSAERLCVDWYGGRNWQLTRRLVYHGARQAFIVPVGFLTDFASVPRLLMSLVPPIGKWTRAAVLHDWLCTVGIMLGIVTSREADGIFRRVMREEGVGLVLRWNMWVAVRWAAFLNELRRPGTWRDLPLMVSIPVVDIVVLYATYQLAQFIVTLLHRLL